MKGYRGYNDQFIYITSNDRFHHSLYTTTAKDWFYPSLCTLTYNNKFYLCLFTITYNHWINTSSAQLHLTINRFCLSSCIVVVHMTADFTIPFVQFHLTTYFTPLPVQLHKSIYFTIPSVPWHLMTDFTPPPFHFITDLTTTSVKFHITTDNIPPSI